MRAYNIEEAKREIKASIRVYLQKDENGRYRMREVNRLPLLLRGAPGIGKTEAAKQIALEEGLGFVSLSITHHTRNTILGLPLIRELDPETQTKYTEYTMSEMIAMVEQEVKNGHPEGILLIDEFTCMSESLVPPMLAFLQTKNIGNHALPEGWVILLCANPPKYNHSSREFDMAIMDRVRVMDVVSDAEEFICYGEKQGIHPLILNYLRSYPMDAHRCEKAENGEQIIVTTRGWENLSWCIQGYESLGEEITPSLVGQYLKSEEIAFRFCQFYSANQAGIGGKAQQEILEGRNLEQHAENMKKQEFDTRFQAVKLLAEAVASYGQKIHHSEELFFFFRDVLNVLEENGKIDGIRKERLAGGAGIAGYEKLPLSDEEREIWKNLSDVLKHSFVPVEKVRRTLDAEIRKLEESITPGRKEVSARVSNVIRFLELAQGEDALAEAFVTQIHRSGDVLDALMGERNETYLKYAGKLLGMDGRLKQLQNKVG